MLPTGYSKRYDWLWQQSSSLRNSALPRFTKSHLRLLEKADFLTPSEKLELLKILLHQKFTGELSLDNRPAKLQLIARLDLQYFINSYRHSRKGLIHWLQVCSNPAICQFVKKHSKTMSPMEAGLLYGYPPTAIMAYMNLIPRKTVKKPKHPADWFFGIVHSRNYYNVEKKQAKQFLARIQTISPKIYHELLTRYRARQTSKFAPQ